MLDGDAIRLIPLHCTYSTDDSETEYNLRVVKLQEEALSMIWYKR
jgi:hypothetical protein